MLMAMFTDPTEGKVLGVNYAVFPMNGHSNELLLRCHPAFAEVTVLHQGRPLCILTSDGPRRFCNGYRNSLSIGRGYFVLPKKSHRAAITWLMQHDAYRYTETIQ